MQSAVLPLSDTLAKRAIDRSLASRQEAYVQELERILEATYHVIERTGSVDPTLREILRECGLSTQAFYRYFASKDELLLVLLDDGRRRLVHYLEHRMGQAATAEGRIAAWIEGVLAQATDPEAAARTQPFLANQDRLAEAFPEQQQESVDLLVGLLVVVLAAVPRPGRRRNAEEERDAGAVYHLVFGTMHAHVMARTRPSAAEVDHVVRFCLRALGLAPDGTERRVARSD
jgi:AcrR family transcriptional regulator